MKKSLIALTVASAAASTAYAQLDLNDPTDTGASVYASEIQISGTGIEVTAAETVQAKLGFTVTDAAPRFVRFDMTNGGNFVGNPTLALTGAGSNTILSAGGDKSSFVLFEVNATTATPIGNTEIVTLTFAATTPNLGLAGSTTIEYTLYEFGAGGGNGELASAGPNTLAAFSPALTVGTSAVTGAASTTPVEAPLDIEVADDSLNFEGGGTTTALGSLFAADVFKSPLLVDGSPANIGDILTSHTIEIDGDFSAAKSVYLVTDTGGVTCLAGAPGLAGTINTADTQVVFAPVGVAEVGDVGSTGVTSVGTVCMTVDGTTVIEEGTYTGTYKPVAKTGFAVSNVPFTLGSLGNTGTTIVLNLTLTPGSEGGLYRNLIRVSNTSSNEGRVFFRMINDAGESSPTVTLGEVTGGADSVPAQGSSQQVNINAIYAAVQAADPTFSVGASPANKLRTVVTGEFGSMDVQTYTVSLDNNSFATF